MLTRILAIGLILICTSVAWFILSSTIDTHTYQSDGKLRSGVSTIWGAPQQPTAPTATFEADKRTVTVPLDATRLQASFELEHRQKGLLWSSTYWVNLNGVYRFRNPTDDPQSMVFRLRFPAEHAIYDGLVMEVNGRALPIVSDAKSAQVTATLAPQETASLRVAYRSRGLESWLYKLGDEVTQTRDWNFASRRTSNKSTSPATAYHPPRSARSPADGNSFGDTPTSSAASRSA